MAKKETHDSLMNIRINKGLRDRFKEYSQKTGVSQSDYLRAFIQELVEGKTDTKTRYLETDSLTGIRKR